MQGRWTVLKVGQRAEFLSECVYDPSAESFGSVTEVCEDPRFSVEINNKSGVYGGLYYNKAEGRTFSYDSSTAFADKLCRLRLEELSSKIVFAVYDVDYGHSTNVCDKMNSRGAFNSSGGARFAATLAGGVVVVGVIVTAVIVVVLASGPNSKYTTSGTEERPEITEKNMRGTSGLTMVVPEFRTAATPPALNTKSTTEEYTGEDTEAPFTESETTEVETTTRPPTTKQNNPWIKELQRIICTVSTKLNAPLERRVYSMCHMVFYDSLYKEGPTSFDPTHLDPALSILVANRPPILLTQLGIGFAYK
ncbi:hypothetical protein HPB52_002048 [Rhipicephalus sanguineus]|uniref:Uncharacterized protein n=1 Tax=Rhipicephalus sanguineus TaxID=34632 RepID=A0A9D4PGL6_RHISA|nr:hypothetical protein HPB52_002048 [Rhipicephalus sanguineus]